MTNTGRAVVLGRRLADKSVRPTHELRRLAWRERYRRVLSAGPGIAHAVDNRDRTQNGNYLQHWRHPIE